MIFTARKSGWIGFDLGDACVKAAQVVRRDGRYHVRSAAIVPRFERWNPAELTAENSLTSADELQAAASLCGGLSGRSAAVILPMSLCETIQVDAEASTREGGLHAVVEAEMHQSMDGYVVGSWPASLQSGKLNVMTVPEAWSDQVSADVAAGRWLCRAIDSLPWALARAVAMTDDYDPERTVAALDWGYGRATLCLVHQRAPAMARCLKDCGFAAAFAGLETSLRLPIRDAERLLAAQGLCLATAGTTDAERAISEALAPSLHQLEHELRRTLGYWQSQTRGKRPQALYLFGCGAAVRGLPQQLASLLDIDVHLWRLPAEDPADEALLPPPHLLAPALAASALAWE
jgi:Tfp pilus assembly PilM family ATPase